MSVSMPTTDICDTRSAHKCSSSSFGRPVLPSLVSARPEMRLHGCRWETCLLRLVAGEGVVVSLLHADPRAVRAERGLRSTVRPLDQPDADAYTNRWPGWRGVRGWTGPHPRRVITMDGGTGSVRARSARVTTSGIPSHHRCCSPPTADSSSVSPSHAHHPTRNVHRNAHRPLVRSDAGRWRPRLVHAKRRGRAVDGKTNDLLAAGGRVAWDAVHQGLPHGATRGPDGSG